MTLDARYKNDLSRFLKAESDRIFLYRKGRVSLYAALQAMGIGPGDEVILPAFTCVVVPNAIIYTGATPIYVDVTKKTLNTTLDFIKAAVTDRTKCILIQNTFGLSTEVNEIVDFARSKGIFTIEDCTHGFGGTYDGEPNGSKSDCAFYSSQWNKPFSTGIGGILLVNNVSLLPQILEINKSLISPGKFSLLVLRMLILLNKYLITDRTYWVLLKLYRFLSKTGLVVGSSSSDELNSPVMADDFFMSGSTVQSAEGIRALKKLDSMMAKRASNAQSYTEFLKKHGKYYVSEDLHENHSFLKYPILVKDRQKFIKKSEHANIRLGEWFDSPIHPIQQDFERWNLTLHDFPIAVELSAHMLNLPTEISNSTKVLLFLEQNIHELM